MAAETVTVKELARRLEQLENEVRELRQHLGREPVVPEGILTQKGSDPVLTELYARGIFVDPSPRMLELAAEWKALPDEQREAVRRELRNLRLDPSLSEIIHKMRGDWNLELAS